MQFTLASDELVDRLKEMDEEGRRRFLFLEQHPDLPRHYVVESFDPEFNARMKGAMRRRMVTPFTFGGFRQRADGEGYELVWIDDPSQDFEWAASLDAEPDIEITSSMPGTIKGFLPFQLQGYNFLRQVDGGIVQWSTGTGKSVVANALIRHFEQEDEFDICLYVVKPHNKINTQRSLKAMVGVSSLVVDGTKQHREAVYATADKFAAEVAPATLVLNYEKFRDDTDVLRRLLTDRRVLIIWDEMPTKMKNRQTKLYKSVCQVLYRTAPRLDKAKIWPASLRQYMLSATPIENSPEDFFNCVRVVEPGLFGTVKEFQATYVATWNYFRGHIPETWKNLDLMGAKAAHITHQVDKKSPDIARQFPEVVEDELLIDLGPDHRKLYDRLMQRFTEEMKTNEFDSADILAKIGVAQMLIDHPLMILRSAQRNEAAMKAMERGEIPRDWGSKVAARLVEVCGEAAFEKASNAKLEALEEILTALDDHEKAIVFTTYNEMLLPVLSKHLTEWGYDHVVYHGSLTMAQKQAAEDRFKSDPDCRIFLSSDSGSDSINLEVASVVVHYDLPWKWSTLIQRQNRAHRITSEHGTVRFYTLLASSTIEDRKMEILATKAGFHQEVFEGTVAEQADAMRMTKDDLRYILTGAR